MVIGPTLLTVVALALVDDDGRILMQRRPLRSEHGGLWEFPGGKVEPGEHPGGALVREIAEELGITLRESDLVPLTFAATTPDSSTRPLVLLLYTCSVWQGEPAAEPGAILRWVLPEAFDTLDMPPLDVPLAAALRTRSKKP